MARLQDLTERQALTVSALQQPVVWGGTTPFGWPVPGLEQHTTEDVVEEIVRRKRAHRAGRVAETLDKRLREAGNRQ